MLQNLTVARTDDIPHSLRQPDEGVVALASACLPVLERGGVLRPLAQSLTLWVWLLLDACNKRPPLLQCGHLNNN